MTRKKRQARCTAISGLAAALGGTALLVACLLGASTSALLALVLAALLGLGLYAAWLRQRLVRADADLAERTAMLETFSVAAERADYVEFLYHIGEELKTSIELDELMRRLIARSVAITQAEHGSIMLLDEAAPGGTLYVPAGSLVAAPEPTLLRRVLDVGLAGWTLRELRPALVDDVCEDARWLRLEGVAADVRAALVVPLVQEGRALGVLSLAHSRVGFFTRIDSVLMSAAANHAIAALHNAQLYSALQASNTQLSTASRLKSDFLARMSHELRTPLNAIIGFTELTLDGLGGPLSERQRANLERVLRNGHSLLELINEILDLSKIEAGRIDLVRERFDLHTLLVSTCQSLEPLVVHKRLGLSIAAADAPVLFVGDQGRLRQVLLNLLSNAIKFTPPEGSLTLRAYARSEPQASVVIEVEDSGVGIAPEHLAQLWDEFWQADGSGGRQQSGTGLGLAIVRRLVALMEGEISVSSTPGQGSIFRIVLPDRPAAETPAAPPPPLLDAESLAVLATDA